MVCNERFEVRLPSEDRQLLRTLAANLRRTEGDVVRILIRSAAEDVTTPGHSRADAPGETRQIVPEMVGAASK